MGKIGLIFDSTSGLNKKEAKERGFGFIPLVITIDGVDKKAGVDVDTNDMYNIMSDRDVTIKTSLPKLEDIVEAFDEVLEKNDKAIFIGLSHKFSGTNNAVRIVSEEPKYKNKIFVYNSQYSSPWTKLYIKDFEWLIKEYSDIDTIFKCMDYVWPYMIAYLSPGDIWWFYKGGRISKFQYLAGSLIKMKPILKIADGEIKKDEVPKIRTSKKALDKMATFIEGNLKSIKEMGVIYKIGILDSDDPELTKQTFEVVQDKLGINEELIIKSNLTSEQTAHMGPGSFGIAIFVSLKDLIKYHKGKEN